MGKADQNPLCTHDEPKKERSTQSVFALLQNVNEDIKTHKSLLIKMGILSAVMCVMIFFLCVAGAYYVKDTVVHEGAHASVQLDRVTNMPVASMGVKAPVSIADVAAGKSPTSELSHITYSVNGIEKTRAVVGVDKSECELAVDTDMQCLAVYTKEDVVIFAPLMDGKVVPVEDFTADLLNPNEAFFELAERASETVTDEVLDGTEEQADSGRKLLMSWDDKVAAAKIMVKILNAGATLETEGCSQVTGGGTWDFEDGAGVTPLPHGMACNFFRTATNSRCNFVPDGAGFGETCRGPFTAAMKAADAMKAEAQNCGGGGFTFGGGGGCPSAADIKAAETKVTYALIDFAACTTQDGACTSHGMIDACEGANNDGAACRDEARCAGSAGACSCEFYITRGRTQKACSSYRSSRTRARCYAYSGRMATECKEVDAFAMAMGNAVAYSG